MVRLIIIAIGVFLIWVLFFSKFEKQRKLIIALVAVLLSIAAIWAESSLGTPTHRLLDASDVRDCGDRAQHSYRSNFDLQLCFENLSSDSAVTRLSFDVIASRCTAAASCQEVQRVSREVAIQIAAGQQAELRQNLSFESVDPLATNIEWSTEVKKVYAVRSTDK